jgi:hypothetical protein
VKDTLLPTPDPTPPLLTVRAALIMFLGLFCGGAAAALTILAGAGVPAAVLAGAAATAAAVKFFTEIIGT